MAKQIVKERTTENNVCFVIMPIADPDGYDEGHFRRVYEDIFAVACEKAGFKPVRADEVKQTNLIHLDILQKLIDSPIAICDLSNRNPNVLFELGLRQAFDKPTVWYKKLARQKFLIYLHCDILNIVRILFITKCSMTKMLSQSH